MSDAQTDAFKSKWLIAIQAAHNLSPDDKRVARWLAANLHSGTTVHRTWQQMKNDLRLPNFAAGLHLTALGNAGFVGERVRSGPLAGFPLLLPVIKSKAAVEAARRAASRRRDDALADAKWLGK